MPDGQVLEFTRVTKRFNDVTAVSDFSARVEPGVVTAFLGPNGAGKTTSLRILLGQVRATSGTATIGGVPYADLRHPLRTIGSVLEETMYRPRRSAARQLTIAAKANGIPLARVDEVLSLVGLESESEGRIGSFSLGMRQRLSVAHALLGDPGALVFDEPANGLDPEGIRWMRLLMRRLADEGRTVLVSSHVLSEVEQVADHVLVLSRGELVLSSGIETLADPASGSVVVDAEDRAALRSALAAAGFEVEVLRSGLTVRGGDAGTVGSIAASAGIALSTLVQRGPTLEDVFIDLVRGGRFEPRAAIVAGPPTSPAADSGTSDAAGDVVGDDTVAVATMAPSADGAEPGAAIALGAGAGAAVTEAEISVDAAEATDADETAAEGESAEKESAEEASADAGEEPVDAGGDSAENASAEEAPAEEAPAEEVRAEDAPAEAGEAEADAASEDVPVEATTEAPEPGPSFDDILRGTSPDLADSLRSVEAVEAGVGHLGETADGAEAAHEQPSGVEFFEQQDESTPDAEGANPAEDDAADSDDSDPRSAAVSSMLAAAARAYYEDEPKEYPLGNAETESETTGETDAAASDGNAEQTSTDDEHHENHEGEHHEGEHHEGEHHESEHHEHENGEHHHHG